MTSDHPEPDARHPEHETAHVDNATIEVGNAELYISPGARQAAHRLAYALVVLFIFTIAIGAANLLFTNSQVHDVRHAAAQAQANSAALAKANTLLRRQVLADCGVDKDLAGLPLSSMPNGHPSELAVRIISDFRVSWNRKSCPGKLPPPSATFIAGARFYHLPVN